MNGYLLDTNHAGALLRSDPRPWKKLQLVPETRIALPRPAIGELWYMVYNSQQIAQNRLRLRGFIASVGELEFDSAAAEEFGIIRAELRRIGRPIPAIDIQIAAIARQNELTVLSADRHFLSVPGLTVENWLE